MKEEEENKNETDHENEESFKKKWEEKNKREIKKNFGLFSFFVRFIESKDVKEKKKEESNWPMYHQKRK